MYTRYLDQYGNWAIIIQLFSVAYWPGLPSADVNSLGKISYNVMWMFKKDIEFKL